MAFKTEYPFTLPKGFVDSEGNLHRNGVMRLATAKDEIVPLQDYRVQANRAYLVIVLLSRVIVKLGDIKYVYVRSWGDGQRVFKIVSFYLLRYQSGSIDDIAPEMRIEVRRASWIPMNEAAKKLAYRGERDIIRRAQEYLEQHPEA